MFKPFKWPIRPVKSPRNSGFYLTSQWFLMFSYGIFRNSGLANCYQRAELTLFWTRTISPTEDILNDISFSTNAAVVEIANQSSLSLKQADFPFSEVHISGAPLHLPESYIIKREKQLTMCFKSFSNNVHRRVASYSIWYVSWCLDQFFVCSKSSLVFIRNINLSFRGFFWWYPIFHYSISERTLLHSLVITCYNLESRITELQSKIA